MALSIPPISLNEQNPESNFGQVTDILIADLNNPLSALTQTALETRLDETAEEGTEIRRLTVIGDKPQPESAVVDISHKRKYKSARKHIVNFKVDETNDVNYAFLQSMIADSVSNVLAWYIVDEKHFFGGTAGIECSITLDHVIPESNDEVQHIIGTLEWTSNSYPDRTDYPLPSGL